MGEHLRWHAPAAQPRQPSRRGTSSMQQENGLTWDLGRQKTYQAQAPRFAARSVLEERRASQPDTSERFVKGGGVASASRMANSHVGATTFCADFDERRTSPTFQQGRGKVSALERGQRCQAGCGESAASHGGAAPPGVASRSPGALADGHH